MCRQTILATMGCRISGQKLKNKQRESRKKRSNSRWLQSSLDSEDKLKSTDNSSAKHCNFNCPYEKVSHMEEINRETHVYDVNISCHEENLDWVENNLLSLLENKLNLNCFLYERDRPAGLSPSQTIQASVLNSRRTIVCLSHEYVTSSWKQYEILLAHHIDPNGLKNRIIPIVLDDCEIPLQLIGLSSLQWPTGDPAASRTKMRKRFFWIRLLRSLQVDESFMSPTSTNSIGDARDKNVTKDVTKSSNSRAKVA